MPDQAEQLRRIVETMPLQGGEQKKETKVVASEMVSYMGTPTAIKTKTVCLDYSDSEITITYHGDRFTYINIYENHTHATAQLTFEHKDDAIELLEAALKMIKGDS